MKQYVIIRVINEGSKHLEIKQTMKQTFSDLGAAAMAAAIMEYNDTKTYLDGKKAKYIII